MKIKGVNQEEAKLRKFNNDVKSVLLHGSETSVDSSNP